MPRVREIDEDDGDEILAKVFTRERQMFGDVLNPSKVLAHCPPILEASGRLAIAVEKPGHIEPGLIALVHLRTAQLNGCPF